MLNLEKILGGKHFNNKRTLEFQFFPIRVFQVGTTRISKFITYSVLNFGEKKNETGCQGRD